MRLNAGHAADSHTHAASRDFSEQRLFFFSLLGFILL
jgi:hypothetical protein